MSNLPPLPLPPRRNIGQGNGPQNSGQTPGTPQAQQPQNVNPDGPQQPNYPQRPAFPGQSGGQQQPPAFPPTPFPNSAPQQPAFRQNGFPPQSQQPAYQGQPQQPFNPAYGDVQASQGNGGYQQPPQQPNFQPDPYGNPASAGFGGGGQEPPKNKKLLYGLMAAGAFVLILIIIGIAVVAGNAGKTTPTSRETGGTSSSSSSPSASSKDYTIDGKNAVLKSNEIINYNLSTTSTGWKDSTPSDAIQGETDYKTADGKCSLLLYQTYISDVDTSKGDLEGTYNLFDVGTGSVVTASQAEADSKSDYITTTSGDQVEIKVLNEKNKAGDEVYVAGRAFSSSKVGFIEVMRCDAGVDAATQWNKTLDGSTLSVYTK